MCTIICIHHPNDDYRVLFLENRDRPVEGFQGNDVRVIGYSRLLCIFDYRSQGVAAGYNLSTGVFGGVANIQGYSGTESRGHILKKALNEAKTGNEALEIVTDAVKTGRYSSGVYLLGDTSGSYTVENFNEEVHIDWNDRVHIVTNRFTHLKLGTAHPSAAARHTTVRRWTASTPFTLERMMRLGQNHRGQGAVCRHGYTLSNLVVAVREHGFVPEIYYVMGEPCSGYQRFMLA